MNIRLAILSAILLIVPASAYGQLARLNMIELNNYHNDDGDIPKCENVDLTDYAGLCLSNSGYALPLCSVMENLGKNIGCWDDEDYPDSNLPQEGGCQEQDDYCDHDENCQSVTVDCIDDRGFDEEDYNG